MTQTREVLHRFDFGVQRVLLDFALDNEMVSWPHVSVATLVVTKETKWGDTH